MVNQLGKFTPNLSSLSQPLRETIELKKVVVLGSFTGKVLQTGQTRTDQANSPRCTVHLPQAKSQQTPALTG